MLGVGILLAEGENEFFYGLETAPAHAEDRLNDAWLQGLETADVPMGSATGDGGSPPASASKKDVNKPLKVAMEAMTRGFEKYSELEMPATNKEYHHNVAAWCNVSHQVEAGKGCWCQCFPNGNDLTRIMPEEPVNGLEENVNFAALERYKWIIARVRSYGMKVGILICSELNSPIHVVSLYTDVYLRKIGGLLNFDSNIRAPGSSADCSPGVPSTSASGADSELTSEEEIARLLNCTDHFSVLGLSRYENVDVSVLKREYRKTKICENLILNVHIVVIMSFRCYLIPRSEKHMMIRREDLNYFRRFQSTSQKNGERGFFASWFAHSEAEGDDPFGESRRIACKRTAKIFIKQKMEMDGLSNLHNPSFLDFCRRQATSLGKYSDFGDDPSVSGGMRCPANSHKPSFHVNTSITSKHNTSKGSSSGQRSGRMPTPNMEETMTEEELFEWLQKAVQAGEFDNYSSGTSNESPSAKAGNGPKSGGGSSSSGNERKKKGKKQW
ncbi:hypothetical protein POTOM_031495 [Populus tomentosa]|uniref:Uncharacterized protein n=1 Tax=Populus tomentosa TaxID=118781 RepID=A0A8X7Z7U5_POPTO|nr:hypothetical protein POTOM_031495 [Populus tomentosa]